MSARALRVTNPKMTTLSRKLVNKKPCYLHCVADFDKVRYCKDNFGIELFKASKATVQVPVEASGGKNIPHGRRN